jgi:hypothetical protein
MSGPTEQERVEERLKAEDSRTLHDRASRWMQISRLNIVPRGPFAAPSAECLELFRDGHFYGCITLVQAVIEAAIRHIHWIEFPETDRDKFIRLPDRLKPLHKKGVISDDVKLKIEKVWEMRNDFHHLDASTDQGHRIIHDLANEKLGLLAEVEAEFFGHSFHEGMIIPKFPKYWDIRDGKILVYIRKR